MGVTGLTSDEVDRSQNGVSGAGVLAITPQVGTLPAGLFGKGFLSNPTPAISITALSISAIFGIGFAGLPPTANPGGQSGIGAVANLFPEIDINLFSVVSSGKVSSSILQVQPASTSVFGLGFTGLAPAGNPVGQPGFGIVSSLFPEIDFKLSSAVSMGKAAVLSPQTSPSFISVFASATVSLPPPVNPGTGQGRGFVSSLLFEIDYPISGIRGFGVAASSEGVGGNVSPALGFGSASSVIPAPAISLASAIAYGFVNITPKALFSGVYGTGIAATTLIPYAYYLSPDWTVTLPAGRYSVSLDPSDSFVQLPQALN